jgi:hypothetical protein
MSLLSRDRVDERLLDGEGIRSTEKRAAIDRGVPPHAKPRLEVVVLTIHPISVHDDSQQRRGGRVEDHPMILSFGRRDVTFVAQAEINRQVRVRERSADL